MGKWRGEVQVGGVRVYAWFVVFDCAGAFDVILGKPWLHMVHGIHDYGTDRIHIQADEEEATIQNEIGDETKEGPETERETQERIWNENEAARLTKKTTKEQERKRAQLERRAEQPLPFPGLGSSPAIQIAHAARTPRPFPAPKPTPPEVAEETKGATETEPDQQLEEEWARINMLQALEGPWAETRFAKYLTVQDASDADTGTNTEEGHGEVQETNTPGSAKQQRAAQRRVWEETIRDAQPINQITAHWQPLPREDPGTIPEQRKAKTALYAEQYTLRQQTKALGEFLGANLKGSSPAQIQAQITSEVRIRRLQGKLDEMRAMACTGESEGTDTRMRPGDTEVHALGEVRADGFKIERGTNTTARTVDPFGEEHQENVSRLVDLTSDQSDAPHHQN
ncbi:hypothetical protein C8J57DRAFT_1533014 [Mycena rebaudengoi]|nr:hypothetical protein C8J57DRAFT_1533014 [Mycena rebaudengoi]